MDFNKVKSNVIRLEDGYFDIREFSYSELSPDSNSIINAFISSNYYLWKEQRHDKIHHSINNIEIFVDWNFHGIYSANLISPEDYVCADFMKFKNHFIASLNHELDHKMGLDEINRQLDRLFSPLFDYFILDVMDDSKLHPYSVFSYFYSGLIIDNAKNKLIYVEFACD